MRIPQQQRQEQERPIPPKNVHARVLRTTHLCPINPPGVGSSRFVGVHATKTLYVTPRSGLSGDVGIQHIALIDQPLSSDVRTCVRCTIGEGSYRFPVDRTVMRCPRQFGRLPRMSASTLPGRFIRFPRCMTSSLTLLSVLSLPSIMDY